MRAPPPSGPARPVDRRRRVARARLAPAALAVAPGCCRILDLDLPAPAEETAQPPPTGSEVDLGVAVHPPGAAARKPSIFAWIARMLTPNSYRAGYAISDVESARLEEAHQDFARLVKYEDQGKGRFRWVPPKGCLGDMHCVFEAMAKSNRAAIEPLAQRFRDRARDAHLDALQLASLIVGFVQSITYEIPETEPFGVLPPALVLERKKGDCDSKALLAHMLLAAVGIRSILVSSEAHRHTMLGVALPAGGTTFTYAGTRYAFTEMTAKGSPIGHINPSLTSPSDWEAVPVKVPEVGAPPPARAAPTSTASTAPGRRRRP